jgi:outer membrane receptor protein involved in Fe transport
MAALGPSQIYAQDQVQDQAQDQAENVIIVTGEGLEDAPSTAAYASVDLDADLIDSAASGRIEDVLRSVSGFQQFRRSDSRSSNPSAQGVTLRGLGGNASSRAAVILDGVPMADPFFGFIPLSAIDPGQLASVRVTRGGGSGPFGAGALSGVIELTSANKTGLAGSAFVNDRAETEAAASYGATLGAGYASVFGRWDRGKGFFTTPADQRVPASARARFDSWSTGLRVAVPVNDTVELQARGLVFDDNRTLRFDGADSSHRGQDASIRLVGRGDWQFDALAYVQARNFSNTVISSTRFVRVLDQRNTPSTGIGGKLELRPPVGEEHTLRIGADYRRSDGELQEEAYSAFTGNLRERRRGGGTNSDLGLFVENDWTPTALGGALTLTGGLRADRTVISDGFYRAVNASGDLVSETVADGRSDWSVSWRAGAAYNVTDALKLRGAAYTGLRLPTLNELYRPFVIFPIVTQANADLQNERLRGFELGVDIVPANDVSLSVTAFDNRVKNAIANVTLTPRLRQRQNLPAINAQGIEAEAGLRLGALRFDGSLTFTDAEVEGEGPSLALDGNRPPQVPRWSGSARIAYSPAEGWTLAATMRHTGTQFEDDQQSAPLPAATTIDLFAEVPLSRRFSIIARAENLLDEEIVTRNSGGAIDLGAPKTVWLGIRLRN